MMMMIFSIFAFIRDEEGCLMFVSRDTASLF